MKERVFLKTGIRKKEKGLGVTLMELYNIVRSGSDDEDGAAQSLATPVSPRGRTKSVSGEISWTAVSSALRAGETYL